MSRIPAPYGLSPEKARQYGSVYKGAGGIKGASDGSSSDSIRASPRFTSKRAPQTANSNSGVRSSTSGLAKAGGVTAKTSSNKDEVGTLKKDMAKAVGISLKDVDTADVDKLRQAAAAAIKMEQRLREVEQERANELRELQEMMSSLQRKEEELSKFVTTVQKRRQETDPYEKVGQWPARERGMLRNLHGTERHSFTSWTHSPAVSRRLASVLPTRVGEGAILHSVVS